MITFIGHCQDSSGNKARKQNDGLHDISPYAIYRRKILSYYCEAPYDSFNRKAKNINCHRPLFARLFSKRFTLKRIVRAIGLI